MAEEELNKPAPDLLDPDDLDVHARAIWDNTQLLSDERIASMYGVQWNASKDVMCSELVSRYLLARGDV